MLFRLMQRRILMLLSLSCIWVLKERHGAFVFPLLLYLLGIFEQVVFQLPVLLHLWHMRSEHFLYSLLTIQKVALVFESGLHMAFAGLLLLPTFSQFPQLYHKDHSHGKLRRSASLQASQNQLHDLQDLGSFPVVGMRFSSI